MYVFYKISISDILDKSDVLLPFLEYIKYKDYVNLKKVQNYSNKCIISFLNDNSQKLNPCIYNNNKYKYNILFYVNDNIKDELEKDITNLNKYKKDLSNYLYYYIDKNSKTIHCNFTENIDFSVNLLRTLTNFFIIREKRCKKVLLYININLDLENLDHLKNCSKLGFDSPEIQDDYLILSRDNNHLKLDELDIEHLYNINIYTYNQYKLGKKNPCIIKATFNINTSNYLHQLLYKKRKGEIQRESAGKLYLDWTISDQEDPIFEIHVDKDSVNGGNSQDVDMVISRYNFHTHPKDAYIVHDCELGWPSKDDYLTFTAGFLEHDTVMHAVSTLEGIYVITINRDAINILLNEFNKLDKNKRSEFIDVYIKDYIKKEIDLSKDGLKIKDGKNVDNFGKIYGGEDYARYINSRKGLVEIGINNSLYNVIFLDWMLLENTDTITYFYFYFPKIGGYCKII